MAGNGKPGRPRKVASQEPATEKPIHEKERQAVVKAEQQKPIETKVEFAPTGCIKTGYTFKGQPVYQKQDGQYVIATGQYVRLSNTDQKKR